MCPLSSSNELLARIVSAEDSVDEDSAWSSSDWVAALINCEAKKIRFQSPRCLVTTLRQSSRKNLRQ